MKDNVIPKSIQNMEHYLGKIILHEQTFTDVLFRKHTFNLKLTLHLHVCISQTLLPKLTCIGFKVHIYI